jgi:peptide/nickel transport system permease protein
MERQKHTAMNENVNHRQSLWSKLSSNKLAMISMIFITLFCILALLGYTIVNDPTPFSNRQCLELTAKKPGYQASFLLKPNNFETPKISWFSKMIWGQPDTAQYILVDSLGFTGTKVIVFRKENGKFFEKEQYTGKELGLTHITDANKYKEHVLQHLYITKHYLLGTDRLGRDVLSRLVIGARVSLSVGLISVIISLFIGVWLGAMAGYFGGRTDKAIMWFVNVSWAVPTLLLVIALTMVIGKGFWQIFIAIGLTMWIDVTRLVRGQIMSLREKEYIEACHSMGFSHFRIITKHLLPGVIGPVIVLSAANFASAILIESGLSFLGVGIQPPVPSWGNMIKEHYGYIILDKAYLAILPGLAIMLLTLAFTIIGNALRDATDTKAPVTSS